jgi:hypothetical protein
MTELEAGKQLSDFERCSWGPKGVEFARFHICGDQEVFIYGPEPGGKGINVELISGADWRPHGEDTRKSHVLRLSKARARALASAIMGAAAEL